MGREKSLTFFMKCDNIGVFLVVGMVFKCPNTIWRQGGFGDLKTETTRERILSRRVCLMWTNERIATNHETYVETAEALENVLANASGNWVADLTVATDDGEEFYLMASDRSKRSESVDWKEGLSVIFVMRYDGEDGEKEEVYEMSATFQTAEGEDHVKEMEMIRAALNAWVEEKVFPNARMAINVRNLLGVEDVQDYLESTYFPGYIRAHDYQIRV